MLYSKVMEYCQKNSISLSAFERKCGLGNGTIKGWISSSPRVDTIKKVATEMGVTVDELLAGATEAAGEEG